MFGLRTAPMPVGFVRGVTRCVNWTRQGGACVPEQPGARLSHDMAREGRWRGLLDACPDLKIGGFTWAWLETAFQAAARLARAPGLERIQGPFVVLAAGVEDLVSNLAAQRVAGRVPGGRFAVLEDAYHELLMETDPVRERFWAEFDRLADEVTPPSG
jgi:lysophospholipase